MHFVTRSTPMSYISSKSHNLKPKFEAKKEQKLFNQLCKVNPATSYLCYRGWTHIRMQTYKHLLESDFRKPDMQLCTSLHAWFKSFHSNSFLFGQHAHIRIDMKFDQ